MKSNTSLVYNFFLILGDFLALLLAFVAAYILRVTFGAGIESSTVTFNIPAITYLGIFITLLPFWILIFAMLGLYDNNIQEKRFTEAGRLFVGSFVGLLFVLGFAYLSNDPIFPGKLVPFYGFIFAFLFLLLIRNIARLIRSILFTYNIGLTNILIVGSNPLAIELIRSLKNSKQSGYKIVGLVGRRLHGVKSFSSFAQAMESLGANQVHSIIQTELYSQSSKNNELLDYAQANHIAFRFTPGNTELFAGNIEVELFRNSLPVVAVHQTALIGWGRVVKKIFDVSVGLILVVLFSPLLLIVSFLQVLSGGTVFFRQVRLTRFNQEFRVYKFRTMRPAYNGLTPEQAFHKMGKPELIKKYRDSGDQLAKDPRISRLGRFLRTRSLDELPQLLNVLKGDLSLVGPRALVPEDLSNYEKRHAILSVKSGLTGLAQVSGRRNISFEERRKLDMYYVQNWSFWLDIIILLKTIRVVLTGEGAK